MTGTLARYLRRRVGLQILGLLLVLTALMQVLELLDVTTDILDRNLGAKGLLTYALLRTPSEIVLALPLATLLGAMTALYAMARNREITASRCAGLSLRRLLVFLLPLPFLLAGLQFALNQTLVPRAEAALKTWWEATAPDDKSPQPTWVRTRSGPVSFESASLDGRELRGLRLYQPDADGQLAQRLTAARAVWEQDRWTLQQVVALRVERGDVVREALPDQPWSSNLRPDDVLRLDVVQPHLSSIMLVDVIVGERVGAQPLSYYQTVLLRSFTAPLGLFVMLLLALPPAGALLRSGEGGGLLLALALGLGFLLCDGLLSALGTGGRIPAPVAALAAPLVFSLIGLLQLFWRDRI